MNETDQRIARILVLHPEAETRRSIDLALRQVSPFPVTVYEASSLTEGLETARRLDPQIVLLDLSGERSLVFDVARHLRRPDRLIVGLYNPLALSEREGELFREAARAGLGDFVPLPVAEEELAAALAAAKEFQEDAGRAEGRTVSFISPKGGVGTTTLAVNSALVLAARGDVEDGVALCDAVVQLGCAATFLGLAPDRDLADLVRDLDDVGPLSTHLVHHQETGLWLLASPRDPIEAARISPQDMSRALIGLRRRFGLVVVDNPPVLDLFTLAVLDLSESIFVVTAPIAPSVLVTARFLDLLEREGFARERIQVVVNQTCPSRDVLPEKIVIEQLGRPVDHVFSWEKELVAAANQGAPLVLSRQRNDFSQAVSRLADAVAQPVTVGDLAMEELRELLRTDWERRHGALGRRVPLAGERGEGVLASPVAAAPTQLPPLRRLRREVFARFLRQLDSREAIGFADRAAARVQVRRILDELLEAGDSAPLSAGERSRLEEEVVAEICGFGPLDPLFDDPTVSDVLVNSPYEVWVDRFGRLERTKVRFDDQAHLLRLLGRLVASHGRHLDEASPLVDVRLADGSRLHALIPPLCAVPVVSIRRQRAIPFRLEELCACGTMSPAMGELLAVIVGSGLNMVVSGGTGAGKTTLLNVLGSFIPNDERVVTIEETVELKFDHPHTLSLEARLPNIEGRGEVTLRTLVRNALRMRPDRIIVGEVRGPEVFDMLQAMNTGHEGSLTTVHANSPADALRRLESLVHMVGFELPSPTIQELLGAAFHVIVQITRFLDGTRRITSIGEVVFERSAGAGDQLAARELFSYQGAASDGSGGRFAATGIRPGFLPRLAAAGLPVDSIFDPPAGDSVAENG